MVQVEEDLWVANMIAQSGTRPADGTPPIRYDALERCLATAAGRARELDASLHMPRIGAGLAGGDWGRIRTMIAKAIATAGVRATVWELEERGLGVPRSGSNMTDRKTIKTSRFLSYILRHDPGSIGLELKDGGWVDVAELIRCARLTGVRLTEEAIEDVLSASEKQRFSLNEDGCRIRANYGHSVPVELEMEPRVPPRALYHGTATRFLNLICHRGIVPRARQFVHLSVDGKTAVEVGRRHGEPVVLVIDSGRMCDGGAEFFEVPGDIWLTRSVPVEFIGFEGDSDVERKREG